MDATLNVLHGILSFSGIYIYLKGEWTSKLRSFHQIFSFLCGVFAIVSTTAFLIDNLSNIELLLEGASIWTTGLITFVSLGVCLVFRKKFRIFLEEMVFKDEILTMPFIEHITKMENEGKLKELKEMVGKSQEKLFKYTRIMTTVYLILTVLTHGLYMCDAANKFISSNYTSRPLAFLMWFPWSLEDLNVYIITFIFHGYCGYLCCSVYPGLQSTIVLLIGQVIRHLRILTFIQQNLDDLILEIVHERDEQWQHCCTMVLSQCIHQYIKVKRFCNRLNVICRPFYLALILDSCLLLCVCTVKVAITTNKLSLELGKYFLHGFTVILLVLMFCLLGQQVQNECVELENVVTEKWYIFNQKHKKNVCIFHTALSQGMPIYIFGSVTLSLSTYTWFIKTEMSFFTLVMSVLEN